MSASEPKEEAKMKIHIAMTELDYHGIKYITRNGGVHMMVEGRKGIIDFWPTTQKWIERGSFLEKLDRGFGIEPLIQFIKQK